MMKSLRKRLENPIIFTITLNVVLLLVSRFVFVPFFEENDDLFLSQICAGTFGVRDYHMIYTNVLLGRLLTLLQGLFPTIRFFVVIQYLFLFVAFSFFTYVLCNCRHGRFLSVFLLLALSYEGYVSFQYTKTSVFCTVIGFILIFEAVRIRLFAPIRSKYFAFAIGGSVLVLFAYLLRDEAFFLGGIFSLILGLYVFIRQLICLRTIGKKSEIASRKKIKELILSYMKVLTPLLVLIVLSFSVDSYAYSSDEAWKSFMNYNEIRTDLIDDRADLLDTTVYGDDLKRLGVSENDAFIFITWQFGDRNIFNEELMEKILDIRRYRVMGVAFVKALTEHLFDEFFSLYAIYPAFLALLVLIGITFYTLCKGSSNKIPLSSSHAFLNYSYVLMSLLATAGVVFFFEYSERWNHRIVSALFSAVVIAFIYFIFVLLIYSDSTVCSESGKETLRSEYEGKTIDIGSYKVFVLVLLLFINIGLILSNRFEYNDYLRSEPNADAFFEYAADNKDILFILDTFTFQNYSKYDLFNTAPAGILDNCVVIGSWYVNSPITVRITDKFGYSDPFEALRMSAEEGRVILVDNLSPEQKAQYLSEHYGHHYVMEPCGDALPGVGEGPTDYTMYRCVVNDGMD